MLDPKLLRTDPAQLAQGLRRKRFELDIEILSSIDSARRELQQKTERLQNERNSLSRQIGKAKAAGEDVTDVMTEVAEINRQLEVCKQESEEIHSRFHQLMLGIPNLPDSSVPDGKNEDDNVVVTVWGSKPEFDFPVRDHVELGEFSEEGLDFGAASKLTGSRFVVMKGQMARLHRALIQFMLDTHTKQNGYVEVYVPYMVNRASLEGTGQLPKFESDLFRLAGEQEYFLIPTAEVPVTNLVRDEIIPAELLPLKWVAHTPCFRSEAGSYGKDTRGMIRQHQFEKVELVQIVKPDQSMDALESLTCDAESILKLLNLPFRRVSLCGADLGFASAKTYDLEVWLPSQGCYREISSCSTFTDFQARRMQARWRNPQTGKPELVHTVNGSGLAVGRTVVAILENGQRADGRVTIPEVLHPYFGGETLL